MLELAYDNAPLQQTHCKSTASLPGSSEMLWMGPYSENVVLRCWLAMLPPAGPCPLLPPANDMGKLGLAITGGASPH